MRMDAHRPCALAGGVILTAEGGPERAIDPRAAEIVRDQQTCLGSSGQVRKQGKLPRNRRPDGGDQRMSECSDNPFGNGVIEVVMKLPYCGGRHEGADVRCRRRGKK